jgi:hypothetical protein
VQGVELVRRGLQQGQVGDAVLLRQGEIDGDPSDGDLDLIKGPGERR